MEVKHTPGPWKVCVGNAGSIFGDLNNDAHNGDNPYIGEVAGIGVDKDIPECTANAQLIAAAPDMFEAIQCALNLKDLWSAQQNGTVSADHAGEMEALQAMLDKLQAAYLKATGQHFPVTNP